MRTFLNTGRVESVYSIVLSVTILASISMDVDSKPFDELIFIDHENLRYVEDGELTRFQVNEIKKNIDKAVEYGIDSYLLFAKETMEAMLTYDFKIEGIGNIGKQAFPMDGEHRDRATRLQLVLREVVDYAKEKKVRLYFHSNQFIFPDEVLDAIKPTTWGTAVCPGRESTWQVYRGKINEFCSMFPELAGLQITGDETQVSVLSCECDLCRDMSFPERVLRLTNETADVAAKHGMEVQMRTWQRMGDLGDPGAMDKGIRDNVYFSIKNTDGDFRLEHGLDEEFLTAAVPERIVCEFDAWREYSGHNYFPCYMGDDWAPRFRFLAEQGIPRVAVRLMWNSNKNPIFDRPWGNYVNIYAFRKLSENPDLDGQTILRDFVEEYYPESARQAAIDLYNSSQEFQKTIYYIRGDIYNADHARVQDDDAEEDLEDAQEEGFLIGVEDFESRRKEIQEAYGTALQLIDKLGSDVPTEWVEGLKDGARVEQYVALSSTDKMEMMYLLQQRSSDEDVGKDISEVKKRMKQRAQEWREWDSESYEDMQGEDVFAHWSLPSEEIPETVIDSVLRVFPSAEDLDIEPDDDLWDVDGETGDGRDFDLDVAPDGTIVEQSIEVHLSEVPPAVQTAIRKDLQQGGVLDELFLCVKEDEEYYRIEIDLGEDVLEIRISTEGRVLEREWD